MKSNLILCLALVLSGVLLGCRTTGLHSRGSQQWGAATNGLQMSLSVLKTSRRDDPEFEIAFRNMGERDVSLNLGMMLANGKVLIPDTVRLSLMDGSGCKRELHFFDKMHPGGSGRMDDYVVPLRAGSIYTLELRLNQFWSPDTKEFELKLRPGRYEVSAHYQGDGAKASNLDMTGIKLMNLWIGELQSNVVIIAE